MPVVVPVTHNATCWMSGPAGNTGCRLFSPFGRKPFSTPVARPILLPVRLSSPWPNEYSPICTISYVIGRRQQMSFDNNLVFLFEKRMSTPKMDESKCWRRYFLGGGRHLGKITWRKSRTTTGRHLVGRFSFRTVCAIGRGRMLSNRLLLILRALCPLIASFHLLRLVDGEREFRRGASTILTVQAPFRVTSPLVKRKVECRVLSSKK